MITLINSCKIWWWGVLSCPLIGASFACPDRRGDQDVWSGRGDRPSKPQRERWSEGGDLHRSASFRPPKPERANRDKFRKPSGMACSRFPNTIFVGILTIWHVSLVCYDEKVLRETGSDRADPARFRKGGVGSRSAWSWSGQFRSGVPDRPIGVRSVIRDN